jgi:hypothetical protein
VSRPDDGLIHAWLDGELDAVEAARVARLVETDAEWGAAAAEARGLIAASSRIVRSLDVVPAGVIPSGSKAGGVTPRRFVVRPWLRIAATVAFVAGVGYVASESRRPGALGREAQGVDAVANSDESDRTTFVPTAAPESSLPVSPTVVRDTRAGGAGSRAGDGPSPQRRELAKTPSAISDSIAAATATARERLAAVSEEQLRDSRLILRQDSAVPSTAPTRSAVTATAPSPESRAIAPPPAAAPIIGRVGERTGAASGAANEQAKVSAPRAPAPTAELLPRQIIDREPSALAASDAMVERVLPGCWRTRTTAPADSVLVDPRILSVVRDSMVIVLNRAALDIRSLSRELLPRATVVRVGTSTLNGTARDANGAVVPFSATRTTCP